MERIYEEDAATKNYKSLTSFQSFGHAWGYPDAVNELHFVQRVFLRSNRFDGFAAQSPDTAYSAVDHASQFGAVIGRAVFP